jgi:hypothetical protein
MAVRVRLRVERGDRVLEVVGLVNSGYEADTPQLMIPVGLARILGLWPPPMDAREVVFETAGGPVRVWVVESAAIVKAVASDIESRGVNVDLVLSTHIDEPLISDILAGKLEIAVEDFAEGLWRFKWEPMGKLRRSEKREEYPTRIH